MDVRILGAPRGIDELAGAFPSVRESYGVCEGWLRQNPFGSRVAASDPGIQFQEFPTVDARGEDVILVLFYEIQRVAKEQYDLYPLAIYREDEWKGNGDRIRKEIWALAGLD